MITKDKYWAEKGLYYYLEDGQEVLLKDFATTKDGKNMFIVIPIYVGEAMRVSGDGGYHHEITCDYEHEGMETLVNTIYCDPPIRKLHKRYADELEKIKSVSISTGLLSLKSKELGLKKGKAEKDFKEALVVFETIKKQIKNSNTELSNLTDKLVLKRQKLSELEDSISDLKSEGVSSLVSKAELQILNSRDFLLSCLEAGGVDNWDGYDDSLDDYRERYPA